MKKYIILLVAFFCGNILIGQEEVRVKTKSTKLNASRPDFVKKSDMKWLEAMEKEAHESKVKKITNNLGKSDELHDFDEFLGAISKVIVQSWYKKGLSLCFSDSTPKKFLKWIMFLSKSERSEAFKKLPFGLSFKDQPADLKAKYGKYLSEDDGYYYIHVDPKNHPHIYLKVNYSSNPKAITKATLMYETLMPHLSTPGKLSVDEYSFDCDIILAMIEDCDNKFFNFRGKENKSTGMRKWDCRVKPSIVNKAHVTQKWIRMEGYYGPNQVEAELSAEEMLFEIEECLKENPKYKFGPVEREDEKDSVRFRFKGIDRNVSLSVSFHSMMTLRNRQVYYAEMVISHSYY